MMLATRLFVAVLATFVLTSCQVLTPTAQEGPRMTSHDGVDIQYDVKGSGATALVLIHGWSCDRSYWSNQIDAFADDFTVVTVDLAGHGTSGDGRSEWSMPAFGGDVAAVVGELPNARVVLVGHSMGGAVMLEAARQIGERVVHIVGVDTLQGIAEGMSIEQAQGLWGQFEDDFPTKVNGFVRGRFFLETSDPALIEQVASDMAAAPKDVALAAGAGLSVYNAKAGLQATSRVPLTLINATIQPTDEDGHGALRDNFQLRVISTSGHFPMLEQPEVFNAVLRDVVSPYR